MGFRVSAPAPNAGYNRTTDWPVSGGIAAGATVDGLSAKGGIGAMFKLSSPASGPGTAAGGWHPTIAWMLGFVVIELVAFHLLSRFLNI